MDIDTIVLGDCYKLIKEVPDKSVDLIVTDPPYDFGGNLSHKNPLSQRKTYKGIDSSGINKGFDRKILDEFVRVRKKTNIYIWCNKEQVYDYLTYFMKERGCNWERLVWAKRSCPPFCHGHYLKDKEYCLYFWETGVELKTTYRTGKTVFVKAGRTEKEKYGHPTAKPEDIIETLIANSCPAGGVVFDPFSGSGTTCARAKKLGRHYLGMEINEGFWKSSRRRIGDTTSDTFEEQMTLF